VLTRRFGDEYALVAGLHGLSAEALRERDAAAPPLARWFALEDRSVVGVATARRRPDDRTFLRFAVSDVAAYQPLVLAADAELRRALTTHADGAAIDHVNALAAAGFETEVVGEVFSIRFERALGLLRRAWTPSGYRLEGADDVAEDDLFVLDNELRNLVPGSDGWTGDRGAFREELRSPEFDAGTYLVAVEEGSGALVGLVRIWRNPSGPRLGLIGVLPQHRGKPIAAALLKEALSTAATWGFDSLSSETSPDNMHTYPRLRRMGAAPIGSFLQMVRQTRDADV
jgi:GNAT superfamily N-acetyltransferase